MEKLIYTIELSIMSFDNNEDTLMDNIDNKEDILMNNIDKKEDVLMNIVNIMNKPIEICEQFNKIKILDDNLYLNELSNKIAHIIKSPNKNDFIKKYNECHNQIKKIDDILYAPNNLDPNIDIKILFEMLKEYEILVEKGDITVKEYKNIHDLVELIEIKMKSLSMDVKEL